jgi:hypothetical protein
MFGHEINAERRATQSTQRVGVLAKRTFVPDIAKRVPKFTVPRSRQNRSTWAGRPLASFHESRGLRPGSGRLLSLLNPHCLQRHKQGYEQKRALSAEQSF